MSDRIALCCRYVCARCPLGDDAGWLDRWCLVTATYLWCCCYWDLSPVSPDVSTLPPWCQLSVSHWQCCMLPCLLSKGSFFGSGQDSHFSIHPGFLVGEWFYCLCDHHMINTFADIWCHWWCIFLKTDVVLLGGGISEHVPVCALKTVQ